MNYWTEFRCLSCARTCCEAPGKEGAAWRALERGYATSGVGCAAVSAGESARCVRCGGRLYAAETYQHYGSNPPWRETAEPDRIGRAIPKSA